MSQENKVVEKSRMQVVEKRALPASTLLFFITFTFVVALSYQHTLSNKDFRPMQFNYTLSFTQYLL